MVLVVWRGVVVVVVGVVVECAGVVGLLVVVKWIGGVFTE